MSPYSLQMTKDYLAAYGANSARWPDPARAVQALEAHKNALVSEISQESALEAWLAPSLDAPAAAPSELLAKRISKAAAISPPPEEGLSDQGPDQLKAANDRGPRFGHINFRRLSQAAAALLVIAAAGMGTAVQLQNPDADAAGWQEAALDLGVDDVYSWVMEAPEGEDF